MVYGLEFYYGRLNCSYVDRPTGSDDAIQLTPLREMTLEFALSFLADDELVEVTPKHIRLRKQHLGENARRQAAKRV